MSLSPKVPLPGIETLLPPDDDGYFDEPTTRVEWPAARIIDLPFSAPAAAGYAAYRARRIASMLLEADQLALAGYAAQFECLAEDLEHAYSLPPPGLGAA